MKTISDCELGDLVYGSEGWAYVRECVHGNRYYAWANIDTQDDSPLMDSVPHVCDMDDDKIPCCG